jgi:hypothetical protein
MSPWAELEWFDFPLTSTFTFNNTTAPIVAVSNQRRVALLFSNLTSNQCVILPGAIPVPGTAAGMIVVNSTLPVVFVQKEHGPLAQVEWSATGLGAGMTTLSVIEVLLKAWPRVQ